MAAEPDKMVTIIKIQSKVSNYLQPLRNLFEDVQGERGTNESTILQQLDSSLANQIKSGSLRLEDFKILGVFVQIFGKRSGGTL